jgi:hypothetical protein
MQRKTRRIITAVAVIALLAAGGAAFTDNLGASGTLLNGGKATIGFGSESIHGAPATAVVYKLSADGQFVNKVKVTLTGDQSHDTFLANLTDSTNAIVKGDACTGTLPDTAISPGNTVVTCDFGSTPVTSVTGFEMSVTNNADTAVTGDTAGSSSTLG